MCIYNNKRKMLNIGSIEEIIIHNKIYSQYVLHPYYVHHWSYSFVSF